MVTDARRVESLGSHALVRRVITNRAKATTLPNHGPVIRRSIVQFPATVAAFVKLRLS